MRRHRMHTRRAHFPTRPGKFGGERERERRGTVDWVGTVVRLRCFNAKYARYCGPSKDPKRVGLFSNVFAGSHLQHRTQYSNFRAFPFAVSLSARYHGEHRSNNDQTCANYCVRTYRRDSEKNHFLLQCTNCFGYPYKSVFKLNSSTSARKTRSKDVFAGTIF